MMMSGWRAHPNTVLRMERAKDSETPNKIGQQEVRGC